ncbi:MAG: hypothetical protein CTY19_00705 [Methylomonas sp.]|jgi:hypothetical protein|nr:MAG: hypothetical protein CTY19_00705 [Methylomonas sp.]
MAIIALLVILAIAAITAWLLLRGKTQEMPVKVMMFVGYFWLITFLQLLTFGLVYFISNRFFDIQLV